MPRVFIGVGSNINPETNVREALRLLGLAVRITGISTFYLSEPQGRPEQPRFYNGVVEIDTDIHPTELKYSVLRPIEDKLGRQRTEDKHAPRTIDLDLLIYGDLVGKAGDTTVPDPELQCRPFVVVPLAELAPDLLLPGTELTIKDLADAFVNHTMQPLPEYTELLRRDVCNGS